MDDSPATGDNSPGVGALGRWIARGWRPRGRPRPGDWEVLKLAGAGDPSGAADLVHRLAPQAFGLAMQMLGRREDAEDVVQESFLRLWRARPSDAHGATLATFFNTIVINRCKTCLARRREWSMDPESLTELSDALQETQAAPAGRGSAAPGVQAALARLPARQRMALAMWAYADADVPQIARALELEPNAAHQLLYRAKKALRNLLQEHAP